MIYFFTILWAALIFFGSSVPGPDLPTTPTAVTLVAHLSEYLILGLFLTLSFTRSKKSTRLQIMVLALVVGCLYALSDEIHQLFVPGREFELLDLVMDFFGLLLGSSLVIWFKQGKTLNI